MRMGSGSVADWSYGCGCAYGCHWAQLRIKRIRECGSLRMRIPAGCSGVGMGWLGEEPLCVGGGIDGDMEFPGVWRELFIGALFPIL